MWKHLLYRGRTLIQQQLPHQDVFLEVGWGGDEDRRCSGADNSLSLEAAQGK